MLRITGWGAQLSPLEVRTSGPDSNSEPGILQRLSNYALAHLSHGKQADGAGVYKFADAKDDSSLTAFITEFGPVWGKVRSQNYQDNGTYTLVVSQSLEQLRNEQRKFAAAVRLLAQVNRPTKANKETLLLALDDLKMVDREVLSFILAVAGLPSLSGRTHAQKLDPMLQAAHLALCELLNQNAPGLLPFNGQVYEFPRTQPEGIRNAIYYQLRRDYMAQREIATCLNCGNQFSVFRRGTRGCSERCRRALRNQRYWDGSKATINAKRRQHKEGS